MGLRVQSGLWGMAHTFPCIYGACDEEEEEEEEEAAGACEYESAVCESVAGGGGGGQDSIDGTPY